MTEGRCPSTPGRTAKVGGSPGRAPPTRPVTPQARAEVRDLRGWLTTTVSRLNGFPGVQTAADYRPGVPLHGVLWRTVADGRITGLYQQVNPEKLTRMPPLDPINATPP